MTPTTCFNTRNLFPAKMHSIILSFALFIYCFSPLENVFAQQAEQPVFTLKKERIYKGKSIHVDDGDTFTFLSSRKARYKIRLDGIDAPEKGMPYARKAKEYLAALLLNQVIELRVISIDRYERYICKVYCNQKEVNLQMVQAGYAWHYTTYNKDTLLSQAEAKARQQKTGLWKDKDPLAPWTVRAYRRAGYSDVRFQELRKQNNPEVRKFLQAI